MPDDQDFTSFDEDKWKAQDAADQREISRLLEQSQDGSSGGLKLDDTPFDQTNKADDAEDFEDISDDDLPDEEPTVGGSLEIPSLTDDGGTSNDADDLFGEGPSSPTDPIGDHPSPGPRVRDTEAGDETQQTETGLSFSGMNFDPDPHMYGAANQDPDIPAPAETVEDLLKEMWPAYKKGHVLVWSELLPPKRATWKGKKPVKKPKHLVTSKLNLDLAPDDEKQFRIPGPAATGSLKQRLSAYASKRLVLCDRDSAENEDEIVQFDIDQESDGEPVMGYTMRDIELACQDWGNDIETFQEQFQTRLAAELKESIKKRHLNADQDDEWDAEFLQDFGEDTKSRPKKRKFIASGLPEIPRYTAPSFDNFEEATKRGAKRVHLDMNDPHLLIESDSQTNAKRARQDDKSKQTGARHLGRTMAQRFNLSNDEAYDLLKENHQSKVRATLGNISVEHSMPAIKLTWPYYKVRLPGTTDEYHRPRFRYKKFSHHSIKFEKPQHQKRKMMKGKAHEVFLKSKDLTLGDNSTAVLFEYCEPRPRVLNNFGMGTKLINYYRRKDEKDEEQLPKLELGEYRTLLPEDRSPFSLFGTVDAGETVPTLHNEMYRAPVFKHVPRSNDFLVVRNTTGIEGSRWYLHKIDHIHVVGQAFPSVEVPGPHSRKVTNASKNRMKMLAFRMIRHSRTDNCQLSEMTRHIADSTDTQNRQKLKEFLQYDRESGEKGMWRLKPGEVLPDENAIRAMIKPEDVSLLDAMQLGIKELEDAGYDPRNATIEDETQANEEGEEDDGEDDSSKIAKTAAKKAQEKQEETLADKMAPWKTTKAFIDACAQKAMLQLHGEGDPTGHGLGFSFIRTSMKGGYIEAVQGPLATSADAIEREKRANGGHAYNVKKQQAMYEEGIREIWEKQKSTLTDGTAHDDNDVQPQEDEDDRFNIQAAATPALFDDGISQISGLTSSSRHQKRAIRIKRDYRLPDGSIQTRAEVVHDPVVISQYMKRRTEAELEMKEYVNPRLRNLGLKRRHWRRLPPMVQLLLRNSIYKKQLTSLARSGYGPGAMATTKDLTGFEFRAPAYTYLRIASTASVLRAMPTMTVLQALESRRNSNDWRRTRPDDKPESNRKSCTKKQLPATQGHLQPQEIKSLRALLESVPIVAKSDTLKQTRSMEFIPPPPRPSFDWWAAAKKPPAAAAAAAAAAAVDGDQMTKKKPSFPKQLQMSNVQARRRYKQRARELLDEEKRKEKEKEKEAKQKGREAEKQMLEQERAERRAQQEKQKQMQEQERAERREQQEKQKLQRQQEKADQARAREAAEAEKEAARLKREQYKAKASLSAQRIAAKFRSRFAY